MTENNEINNEIDQLREEIVAVVSNIENIVDRFDTVENKIQKIEDQFDKIEYYMSNMSMKIESIYDSNLMISKQNEQINTDSFLLNENIKELIHEVRNIDVNLEDENE